MAPGHGDRQQAPTTMPPWYVWPFVVLPWLLNVDTFVFSVVVMTAGGIVLLALGEYQTMIEPAP